MPPYVLRYASLAIGVLTACVCLGASADEPQIVAQYKHSAGPTAIRLVEVLDQQSGRPSAPGLIRPDYDSTVANLANRGSFAAVLVQQWPLSGECRTMAEVYRAAKASPAYLVGERRLAVIVNPHNPLNAVGMTSLHRMLASLEGEAAYLSKSRNPAAEWPRLMTTWASWDEFGSPKALPVRVYAEGVSSWAREELAAHCLRYAHWWLGSKCWTVRPFRKDIIECMDGEDVISRVRRDRAGIGFVQYAGQRLVGVKVLAIEDDFPADWPNEYGAGGPILPVKGDGTVDVFAWEAAAKVPRPKGPVAMKLSLEFQPEYPLSEPLLLYVHPKAPENVKEFARFCVSDRGADVVEGLGFITPRQHFAAQAQQRLAQLRRGDCPKIAVCTDTKGRWLARELAFAYTKDVAPLKVEARAEDSKAMGGVFVSKRHDLMLSIGVPDPKYSGRKWQESLAAGEVKAQVIAAHAIAIVAHEQLDRNVLAWDELLWIAKGKVKNWRELRVSFKEVATTRPASSPETSLGGKRGEESPQPKGALGGVAVDDTIVLAMPGRRDPTTRLFARLLQGIGPADADRRDSDAEVLSAVQENPGTIGIINATSIPRNPKEQKLRVLGIVVKGRSLQPTPADVFTVGYPLAEPVYLWTWPATSPDAQAFLQSMRTSPGMAAILHDNGLLSPAVR